MTYPSTRGRLILLAAFLAFGEIGCGQSPLFDRQQTLNVPQVAGTALDVITTNGAINAAQSDRSDVQIAATIRADSGARAEAAKIVVDRGEDQQLSIRVDWPDGRAHSREGCDFEILLPAAIGVKLVTDNGSLSTMGLSGAANLESSNGNIAVEQHSGPIVATTLNGEVSVSGATESLRAEATNGTLQVALASESPGPVQLQTTNGLIDLAVGPGFAGDLTLETTIGAISVDDTVKARRVEDDSHRVKLEFGNADQHSAASTVTGMVHVGTRGGHVRGK